MKHNNLSEQALIFDLPKRLITNEKIQGGQKRELNQIALSMIGAVALWAGIEPAFHLLQMLKIVRKRKPVA